MTVLWEFWRKASQKLFAAFLNESSTRGYARRSVAGNPRSEVEGHLTEFMVELGTVEAAFTSLAPAVRSRMSSANLAIA